MEKVQSEALTVDEELERRMELWAEVKALGGPLAIPEKLPEKLVRALFVNGEQRMYADIERTKRLPESPCGVTLSVKHRCSDYPDDLSESGVTYHHPKTLDVGRNKADVSRMMRAIQLRLPVFVIVRLSKGASPSAIHLGWVDALDDAAKTFFIAFGEHPPTPNDSDVDVNQAFDLFKRESPKIVPTLVRTGAQKFRDDVFNRYGATCAFCGIHVPVLLDAAHIVPVESQGSDNPANGLVLCALHHRAFDEGLVAIDPSDVSLRTKRDGPSLTDLLVDRHDLSHLKSKPHQKAVKWRYERWSPV